MDERLTAILPCNDLDAAQVFFERLGFERDQSGAEDYRMMSDGRGGFIHLVVAVTGWLRSGRNPFGLYLYRRDVDELAARFADEIIGKGAPGDTPWGMYEFALDGPDGVLVRIGWPTRLR
ncbi:MAG: hypothetical protein ACREFH_02025 [Stellaceae bacterium]